MRTPNAYAIAVRKADGSIVNTAARLPKWSDKNSFFKLPIVRGGAVLIQSMGLGIEALNYSANVAFGEAEAEAAAEAEAIVPLRPAVIEGEGDFAGITGAVPGLFPVPTQSRPRDEMKKGGTAAAAGSIVFALFFNVLLFVAAPLLLTNALFIATGWATAPAVQSAAASNTAVGGAHGQTVNAPDEAWYAKTWRIHALICIGAPSIAFNLIDGMIRMSFFLIMIVSFHF